MTSLKHKTVSGMLWVGLQRFGTVIISFLSNIVLARLLTPADFGYIGMLMVFIAVSTSFVDGGFGSALIQKSKPTQEDYSTVFYWNIFLSIVLYTILYFCAPLIADFYKMDILTKILRVEGVILIINALTIIQFNKLRKTMQFKKIAYVNITAAIISVIVAIIYAYYGGGVWALVWQQIVLGIVNVIMLFIVMPWKPSLVFSIQSFKGLFKFGSFVLLSSLINTAFNNMSALIVGRFFSAGTLGYLTQAQKIENVGSTSILTTVEQVTYPLLVEVKEDFNRMTKVLRTFNVMLMAFVTPVMLSVMVAAKPIIIFLFGNKWLPSAEILQILCIAGIFVCLQGCNYNVIAAIGKSNVLFRWTIIKRSVGIGLIFLGLFVYGFQGVLWGLVGSAIFIWISNAWLVSHYIRYNLSRQLLDLLPIMILGIISLGLTYFFKIFILTGVHDIVYAIMLLCFYLAPLLLSRYPVFLGIRENIKSVFRHNT
ncbi:MAG: lipopolysaccharide biosynthesis protein [Bacteroides sp.]|nr:lipopolysaccharide biosynthesis protein [Bacteroides sp.]